VGILNLQPENLAVDLMSDRLHSELNLVDAHPPLATTLDIDPIELAKVRPPASVLARSIGNEPTQSEPPLLDRHIDLIFASIELTELKLGNTLLRVQHSTERPNRHKPYYSTIITNRSTEKIRIDRFGTYIRKGRAIVLHSITGGYFSPQQFQEWYGVGGHAWLEPGRSVTDPNNHSNLNLYWAYTCTTASGRQFVAGAPWRGSKSWWQIW
jgi:hypothetical protein